MTTVLARIALREHPAEVQSPCVPDAGSIAAAAVRCLLLELETWPKPGLVSHVDTGSHADMTADTFRASAAAIAALSPCSGRSRRATAAAWDVSGSSVIEAEAAMLAATRGVNTHRGAIFGLGLLCAAAGARAGGRIDPALPLGAVVSRLWGSSILDGPVLLHSHGGECPSPLWRRRRAHRGRPGISQRLRGRFARPATGRPQWRPDDAEAARVEACFALIAALEDTNLLHRGGPSGLELCPPRGPRFSRRWRRRQPATGASGREIVHESFVARRLSPGGSADLLAMTLFVEALRKSIALMVNTILLALAPIFFVLALGYGAGRLRMVDNQHVDSLNALVMNFALPASLFAATASAPRSELFAQAPLFLILGAVMLVVFLAWYFLQVRLGNAGKADASLQGLTIAFPNLAGVGLPILADVLGPSGTVPAGGSIGERLHNCQPAFAHRCRTQSKAGRCC